MGKPTKQVRRNKCSFKDCNNSLAKSPSIHLFRFPINEERCKQWIIHSGRTDLLDSSPKSLNRKKVLCSIHFKDGDFLNPKTRNRLTRNAVPKKYDSEGVTPHLDSPELKADVSKTHQKTTTPGHYVNEISVNANIFTTTEVTTATVHESSLDIIQFWRGVVSGSSYFLTMPGRRCVVASCRNTEPALRKKSSKIIFHSFPRGNDIRKEWVHRCKREETFIANNSRVCSDHFTPNDYERDLRNELLNLPLRRILKKTAVPTVNLGDKIDMQIAEEKPLETRFMEKTNKLQEDMDNYIKFKLMGGPKRMKPTVVPHIFDGQQERERSLTLPLSSAAVASTSTLSCERARIWAMKANREDLLGKLTDLHKSYKICEHHFEERMFTSHLHTRLFPIAIPTLFPSLEWNSRADHTYSSPPLQVIDDRMLVLGGIPRADHTYSAPPLQVLDDRVLVPGGVPPTLLYSADLKNVPETELETGVQYEIAVSPPTVNPPLTSPTSTQTENVAETEAQVGIASTSKESQLFAFEFIDPSEISAGQNSGSTSSVEPKKIKLEKDEPEYVDPQQLNNNPDNSSEMLRLEEIKSEIELEYNELTEPEYVDPHNPENSSEVLRLKDIKSEIKLEYNELSEPEYVDPQQLNYNPEKSSEILRLEEIKSEIKLEYNELSADLDNCEFAADIEEESRDFSVAIKEEVCDIEKLDYN